MDGIHLNSVFDFYGITQGCWKTCDTEFGVNEYKVDHFPFPVYRDEATRPAFNEVADFFGCVDVCQNSRESEKLALLFPIGLFVVIIIGILTCLMCYFCKRWKRRKPVMVNILDDSSIFWVSTPSSYTPGIISDFKRTATNVGSKVSDSGAPRPFTVNSWVEDSPSKPTGIRHDLNESKSSTISTPTNVKRQDDKMKRKLKKRQLLDSSRKLGRRLISMDKESESTDKKRKSNQST